MRKAIAIDFDGCLCGLSWPGIGEPNMAVINAAIRERESGTALILWTCRVGKRLEEAVEWCRGYGLEFDAVNENLPDRLEAYRADPRKVNADEYWDDLAVVMPGRPRDRQQAAGEAGSMTPEEAINYLTPIFESARLPGYKAALGVVLDAAKRQIGEAGK